MMPAVVYFHLWGDSPYEYSEGFFYTVAEQQPVAPQVDIPSSGHHVGIFPTTEVFTYIKNDLLYLLTTPQTKYMFATVNIIEAKNNDHYYSFSTPPTEWQSVYIIDDGALVLAKGTDLLSVNQSTSDSKSRLNGKL
jgi:hypothetical protein